MADNKTKRLTNEDILLSYGLVEYYDPIEDAKKQVDIETAKRIATVNEPLRKKLQTFGIID